MGDTHQRSYFAASLENDLMTASLEKAEVFMPGGRRMSASFASRRRSSGNVFSRRMSGPASMQSMSTPKLSSSRTPQLSSSLPVVAPQDTISKPETKFLESVEGDKPKPRRP